MTTTRSRARNKKERNLNSTDQNRKEHTILDTWINWLVLSKAARTHIFPTKILNVEFYLIVKWLFIESVINEDWPNYCNSSKCWSGVQAANPASGSSVTNEASLTSLDAKGATINWSTNGGNATGWLWYTLVILELEEAEVDWWSLSGNNARSLLWLIGELCMKGLWMKKKGRIAAFYS